MLSLLVPSLGPERYQDMEVSRTARYGLLGRWHMRAFRVHRVFFISIDACGFPASCLTSRALCLSCRTGILATRLSTFCLGFFLALSRTWLMRRIGRSLRILFVHYIFSSCCCPGCQGEGAP